MAQADRLACGREWSAAKTDDERAKISARYREVAKGNRIEGDAVPTKVTPTKPN